MAKVIPFTYSKEEFQSFLDEYSTLSGVPVPIGGPLFNMVAWIYNLTILLRISAVAIIDIYNVFTATGERLNQLGIAFHAIRYLAKPSVIRLFNPNEDDVVVNNGDTYENVSTGEIYIYEGVSVVLAEADDSVVMINTEVGVSTTAILDTLVFTDDNITELDIVSVQYIGRNIETDDEFRTRILTIDNTSMEAVFINDVINSTSIFDVKIVYNRTHSIDTVGDITLPAGALAIILPFEDFNEEVGPIYFRDIIGYTTDNTTGSVGIDDFNYNVEISTPSELTGTLNFLYYVNKLTPITITIEVEGGFDTEANKQIIREIMFYYPFAIGGTFSVYDIMVYLSDAGINYTFSAYINVDEDHVQANATERFVFNDLLSIDIVASDGIVGP